MSSSGADRTRFGGASSGHDLIWSSKATDIARNCGFDWIERIERALLYLLRFDGAHPGHDPGARQAGAAHLHERMTESVMDAASAAQLLFESAPGRPCAPCTSAMTAVSRWNAPTSSFGLALSPDEIAYC